MNLVDPLQLIGYSQLPVSSLAGLEEASHDRLTDGTVIHYQTFGTDDIGSVHYGNFDLLSEYAGGRTATHEIGHVLGLRHVWGDENSCSSTDYVADTPIQNAPTYGCPSTPEEKMACGHDKMYQNYMDYTDDPCYNLFTKDQIARMTVVLANCPRRASLLVSPGATDPVTVANDLGIKKIVSPDVTACAISVTPSVQVRNYGSNAISSARIQLSLDGVITETKDFSFTLGLLDTATVSFSPLSLAASSTHNFLFKILLTNGGTDGKISNDSIDQIVVAPAKIAVPFLEPFNSLPANWSIVNRDGLTTWQIASAPNSNSSNTAMYMDFYDYQNQGTEDALVTPSFDLSTDTIAIFKFDFAYASDENIDQLRVLVSTSCDFSNAIEIFNKSGTALATAASTGAAFVPSGSSDWKTQTISLSQFLGQPNVQIAFVTTNGYGNNLYLDNVSIITGAFTDISLVAIKSPSPVSCVSDPTPVVTVGNNGSTTITSVTISTAIHGDTATPQTFSGLQLSPGEEQDFTLATWSLAGGLNKLAVTVQNNNGFAEISADDNTLNLNQVVSTTQDIIPLRENFETNYPDWTVVSQTQQMNWISVTTPNKNKGTSLGYDAFTNLAIGSQAWLVSPVLDFSRALKSSLFFDLSYALSTKGNERLQILTSTDCGETFPNTVFDQTGAAIENGNIEFFVDTPGGCRLEATVR